MPRTEKQIEALRADRKKIILDAALHVFSEQGYHGASISMVSKHAKISKGLMYNYFDSKEDLLNELLKDLIDSEMEILHQLLAKPISTKTVTELVEMTINTLKKKPVKWKLYLSFSTQPRVLELITKRYEVDHSKVSNMLLTFFTDKGHKNPALQMQYFFMALGGLKFQYVLSPEHFPVDELAELLIQQFIDKDYVSNKN